jgi:uncharacterized protein (DUF427 family)
MAQRPESVDPGARAPGYARAQRHRLAFVPRRVRVEVRAGETAVADTDDVVQLEETKYPVRHYLAREGVDMSRLERTDTVTFCPFKGLATYYVVRGEDGAVTDAAWSYEQPYLEAELLRDRLCFDAAALSTTVHEP